MHLCAKCKQDKPIDDFSPRRGTGWYDDNGTKRYSYCQTCMRTEDKERKRKDRLAGKPASKYSGERRNVKVSRHDMLPVEPFALWLKAKVIEYGSVLSVAHATGLGDRRIRSILGGEQKYVSLDTVDFALVREGSTFLFQLYGPELYPGLDTMSLAEVLVDTCAPAENDDVWLLPASVGVLA